MINPLWIIGGILGLVTLVMILSFVFMKEKKEAIGFDRNIKDSVIIRRLLGYAKPYVWRFVIVLLIMGATVAADIVMPLVTGDITTILGRETGFEYWEILRDVGLYAGILILSLVCTYIQAIILQKTGQRIVSTIRQETFEHIESLSHQQFSDIPVGTLVTRVTNDTHSLSMMFTNLIVNLVKNVCMLIGVTAAMFAVNVKLTLMILCFAPFMALFTVIFRKYSRRAYRQVKNATTDINVYLSENLSGMKVTQMFCEEDTKLAQFRARNRKLQSAKTKQIFVFGIFRPSIYMLYIFSMICLFYFAGHDHINEVTFLGQSIGFSTLVVFYQYITTFFNPIQNLADSFNILQSAFASAEKIFTILDIEPQIRDGDVNHLPERIRGEIEFRHVWFRYRPERRWILQDLSFHVKAGETIAFVGPTGAGKTTILSLLCRNYDIQKGEILVDGVDIRTVPLGELRRQFGQMLQDVFLFSGTIRSNIDLGDGTIADETIAEGCRYVNADRLIGKLEKGLEEPVRERGANFSAGERQLLSFVRTIVRKPAVMILDEATANIDTETERLIQNSLENMMHVGTMLMVAHRLSTIQHADRIFVIQNGEIVEQGSHQELLHLRGKYYDLYQLQFHREKMLGNAEA